MHGIVRIVVSGLLAGIAYLLAQTVDLKVTGNNVDDRVLLGGIAPLSTSTSKKLGTAMHLGASIAAGVFYVRVVKGWISGPGWWRGVVFASVENALLYPWLLLEDFHPAIRDGRLDSYQSWTAFLQGVWRHVWFGAVLGAVNRK
ncbi:MAG: hypothetical protein H0V98_09900 [Chloroflexia bacterium]|nr:hypothetical protein [Chloroflexia bacterium]